MKTGRRDMSYWIYYINLAVPAIVKLFVSDGSYSAENVATDRIYVPLILIIVNITVALNNFKVSIFKCAFSLLFGLLFMDLVGYVLWSLRSQQSAGPAIINVNMSLIAYQVIFVAVYWVIFSLLKKMFGRKLG